jgi:hypothetical protein
MNDNQPLEHSADSPRPAPQLDFAKIALGQRIIIFSMVVVVIDIAIGYTAFGATREGKLVELALDLLAIAMGIGGAIYLGLALKLPIWLLVVCALAAFIAIGNLLMLAILNQQAITALKSAGYRIGFFGSSKPS